MRKLERFISLSVAVRIPVFPLTNLYTLLVRAVGCQLTILVKVTPETVFFAVNIASFGGEIAILVKRSKQSMPYPARAILTEIPTVSEPHLTRFKWNLGDVEIGHNVLTPSFRGVRRWAKPAAVRPLQAPVRLTTRTQAFALRFSDSELVQSATEHQFGTLSTVDSSGHQPWGYL